VNFSERVISDLMCVAIGTDILARTAFKHRVGMIRPLGLLIQVAIIGVGKLSLPGSNRTMLWGSCRYKGIMHLHFQESNSGLLSHSKIAIISASGNVEANAFMFHVGIPLVTPDTTAGPSGQVFTLVHPFANQIQGMELLLLGMDIVSNCSLTIECDRHYSLC
jgi:hypothetical protein